MKQAIHILTACFLILSVHVTKAQNAATPNAGFENWTQVGNHFDPNSWNTLNPVTSALGIFTCTRATGSDVHSGTYAIKLTTKLVLTIKANGIATTAQLITTPPYGVTGGLPYTQRPDSIVGWYKYAPASAADSGFMELVLLDASNDTVGHARYYTPNSAVSSYTRFSAPVIYSSPANPVNSYWILTSSDGVNPVVNSSLFIDDLDLVFNSSGIGDDPGQQTAGLIGNLVYQSLFVRNNTTESAVLEVFGSDGRQVLKTQVKPGETTLDVNAWPSGIYFYTLRAATQTVATTGKLFKY